MKIQNLRNKTLVFGNINVNPGETKDVPDSLEVKSLLKNGYIKAFDVKIGYTKEGLRELKMAELREIGKPLGAADTSKEELIEEILEKQR